MTSQGQRFRRRALRRGYKVDEVDAFLDRVEATLAGEQVGPPVGAQEVHDVVFRVRFGGYDEWQVDLHLDRVERQLAEFEERGGRPVDPMRDSMRGGLTADRSGAIDRGSIERSGPPALSGGAGGPGGMPRNGMAGAGMGGGPQFGGPQQQFGGPQQQPQQQFGNPGQPQFGGPPMSNPGMAQTERIPAPIRDDRMMPPQAPQMPQRPQMPQPDPYGGRYDEPTTYGGQPQQQLPQRNAPQGYDQGGYDEPTSYNGFEPGRHGRSDMTAEIRMPERDPYGGPPMPPGGMGGPMQQQQQPAGMPGSPMPGAPMSGPPGGYGQPPQSHLGPPIGEPGGELYRVDQLRRTFQPRRFGSGYDPMQVDRLFEGILQAMTGRGPMPVNENDLDMLQFGLVPNGYFEAEVDAALREVKDILLRGGRR
ncbi:DivIVA domain-containing protein [Actinoplanes octamycinicus]|uniref:DivIVA domain-containing protein n=1 Tax=Actinoplanes octamycinicus TaxID=135948 RepID=A0A7W7GRP7_9ACTN|nr:DivIVA domain-containing protein [Actinoplanes octamycinicus]MBB4736976.1 DivIVA domain-containing protein [Actinoplanes octamycinicus]GIE62114.1 hypothetical protein Aoc01nite_75160 [Actinoplanes octamycinicus]